MKHLIKILSLSLLLIAFLSSCSKDQGSEDSLVSPPEKASQSRNYNGSQQVIVLAAPSVYNEYYSSIFDDIVSFQVDYANKIDGRDEVIILVDKDTKKYYQGKVPDYVLVDANIEDIWIRDFGATIADRQVKFAFKPDYMSSSDARVIDNSYTKWMKKNGLSFGQKSNLILDGGNVVDNGKGKVIITDRFLYDNPYLSVANAKKKLKKLFGAHQIAIIKESPGDVTGHADGMVMWADDNTILLHEQEPSVHSKIVNELNNSFPGVKIVIVPDYFEYAEWQGFGTACNIFVNSLVTNDYIYVPTFDAGHDAEMVSLIQSYTNKEVVPVPAEKVCFMGGSVRCLSWQTDGFMADALLEEY